MKGTNPDHYKADSADFVKFIDDPQISKFGKYLISN